MSSKKSPTYKKKRNEMLANISLKKTKEIKELQRIPSKLHSESTQEAVDLQKENTLVKLH